MDNPSSLLPPHGFRPYTAGDRTACLAIFDANCPEFFAPNEREDYAGFLDSVSEAYTIVHTGGGAIGAYGVFPGAAPSECRLSWILLDPALHGRGIGRVVMSRAAEAARTHGATVLRIAASQKSAPFFAHFGATVTCTTPAGWGPGMHRVDMDLAVGDG
ncbi:MAG TPA: GNAT family N-acetyltransferase [Gemmatimonadaceae bacterium]|nr:GNAT family N-acetyltransferase [Gemmatimonadaceae bacterium]